MTGKLTKPRKDPPRPNAASFNERTAGDAAAIVLRKAKRPMRLVEIQQEIERRSLYQTESSNLKSTIATALRREARFRRVGKGRYELSE